MKSSIATICAAAMLFAAAAEAAPFQNFVEARAAIDKALREKRHDEAERLIGEAAPLAGTAGEKDQLFDLTTRAHAEIGAARSAALLKLAEPVIAGCTNFTRCPQTTRNAFARAAQTALAAGDTQAVKRLLDALAKDRDVTDQVFNLWNGVANNFVDDALARRAAKPVKPADAAAQAEIVAGFRAEASTFGLNTGALIIDGLPALDQARVATAVAILTKLMPQERLSAPLRLRREQAMLAIRKKTFNEPGMLAAYESLKAFALGQKPVSQADTNALLGAVETTFNFRRDRGEWAEYTALAREYRAKLAAFQAAAPNEMKVRELAGLFRMHDMKAFDALASDFAKLPQDAATLDAILRVNTLASEGSSHAAGAVRPKIAGMLAGFISGRSKFSYGMQGRIAEFLFHDAVARGDLKAVKSYYDELVGIRDRSRAKWEAENNREKAARELKQPYTRDQTVTPTVDLASKAFGTYVRVISEARDYQAFYAMRKPAAIPKNPGACFEFAATCHALGKNDEALAALDMGITNTSANAGARFNAQVLKAAILSPDIPSFTKALLALRPYSDAQGKAGEPPVESDKRFFNFLRGASLYMYHIASDRARYPYILAIVGLTHDMMWPEERLLYTARFVASAPRTAEGALAAGIFDKYPVENRMGRYGIYDYMTKDKQVALLKSTEKPRLEADTKGKEGGVVVLFDPTGVHFYVRLNDPDAARSRDGYADGANLEFSIMPGEMTAWHWNIVTVRNPRNQYDVEWDSPIPGRKRTRDFVEVDSVSTDKAHCFHIFTPWVMFYDRLPANGDTWRFVCCAGWAGQFGALGGGAVHELGRGMQIKFEIGGSVANQIREGVVKQAAGEYRKVRDQWENAVFWSDPHMGDAPFYGAVVKPYLAELDAQAKIVTDGQLDKAGVDRIYRDYIRDLADFRLMLDARRADYLKAALFAE